MRIAHYYWPVKVDNLKRYSLFLSPDEVIGVTVAREQDGEILTTHKNKERFALGTLVAGYEEALALWATRSVRKGSQKL